jgi:D-xylose transport system permease protein
LADTLELDKQLFGMIIAFAVLSVAFQFVTDGKFLSARNIFNISVQTVSVGMSGR